MTQGGGDKRQKVRSCASCICMVIHFSSHGSYISQQYSSWWGRKMEVGGGGGGVVHNQREDREIWGNAFQESLMLRVRPLIEAKQ